jgi:RNA polymerase sigma-70 factor (TIGR02943 family)
LTEINFTIKEWVEEYGDDLYRWACHKTSSIETAEDLVHDTFLAAVQSYSRFEGKSSPKTWLFSILNKKIADYHRKKFRNTRSDDRDLSSSVYDDAMDKFFQFDGNWKKAVKPLEWDDTEENLLDNDEFKSSLQGCMDGLPSKWLAIIQLKYLDQKDGKEICQDLGVTTANFWQILHRAKLQLRQCLELQWFKR